jgi:hypothetical protein
MEARRYVLVPKPDGVAPEPPAGLPPRPPIRRYALARLGPSSRSALGADRLERLEEIAHRDRRP